jgi:hypothetical protein
MNENTKCIYCKREFENGDEFMEFADVDGRVCESCAIDLVTQWAEDQGIEEIANFLGGASGEYNE